MDPQVLLRLELEISLFKISFIKQNTFLHKRQTIVRKKPIDQSFKTMKISGHLVPLET